MPTTSARLSGACQSTCFTGRKVQILTPEELLQYAYYLRTIEWGVVFRYTYMHTYVYTYIHTYIHTYMHAYMHTYIHTYIHT
jgi:hypothetical protein